MTLDEAKNYADQLTMLCAKYNDAHRSGQLNEKQLYSDKFTQIAGLIKVAGFKLRKRYAYNSIYDRKVYNYSIGKDTTTLFESSNNRDPNLNINNDCTTRCIVHCTGEDYMKIRNEQFSNSSITGCAWNNINTWSKSLTSRGYKRFDMPRHITRATFIKKCGKYIKTGIIATRSSGHLAAIDMAKGKVLDTWNSTGGRIKTMFIHESQYDSVVNAIKCCI
jgi:hypothetical protein